MLRSDTRISENLSVWLDVLRGVAAFAVVLGHSQAILLPPGQPPLEGMEHLSFRLLTLVSGFAHPAVMVFFVLSGYLVGGPYLIRSLQGREEPGKYIVARLSRMYTVLLPALALSWAAMTLFNGMGGEAAIVARRPFFFTPDETYMSKFGPAVALCNAAFLQMIACGQFSGNLSLWSLSHEFWYYILFFFLVGSLRNRLLLLPAAAIAAMMAASTLRPEGPADPALRFLVYFVIWLMGALLFALRKDRGQLIAAGLLLGLAALVYLLFRRVDLVRDLAVGLVFAIFLGFMEKFDPRPAFLDNRLTRGLANISFSLYAIHLPVVMLGALLLGYSDAWSFAAKASAWTFLVGLEIVVAVVFYVAFERHTHKVRQWMTRVLNPQALKQQG